MLIHGIQFVNVRYARRKVNDMETVYICMDCEHEFGDNQDGICPDCGGWVTGVDAEPYDTLEEKWL